MIEQLLHILRQLLVSMRWTCALISAFFGCANTVVSKLPTSPPLTISRKLVTILSVDLVLELVEGSPLLDHDGVLFLNLACNDLISFGISAHVSPATKSSIGAVLPFSACCLLFRILLLIDHWYGRVEHVIEIRGRTRRLASPRAKNSTG